MEEFHIKKCYRISFPVVSRSYNRRKIYELSGRIQAHIEWYDIVLPGTLNGGIPYKKML